ncbi:MAG: hypothetical protein ACKOWR_01080 [Micrococcales bacterium]
MSSEAQSLELVEQLKAEVERIKALPLTEQVAAFSALRELLENTLNQADGN